MTTSEWDGTSWQGSEARIRTRSAQPAPRAMVGFGSDGGLLSGGVTTTTAVGLSAFWRGLDILGSISQLAWNERIANLELPPSRLVVSPSAFMTRREWVIRVVRTLALFDTCYLLKAGGADDEGVPLGLWPLDPTLVMPATVDMMSLLPPQEFWVGGTRMTRDQLVVINRAPNPTIAEGFNGLLTLARVTFAAALAAERYASRYWQAGGSPTTVLETDAILPDGEADQMSDRWADRRSRGPDYAPVLEGGLKARDFGADPTASSAVEARKEQVADVGRYLGIPTSKLNAPTGDSEAYSTTEAQGIDLLTFTLSNYIGAIEDAISDQLPDHRRRMHMDPWSLTAGTQYSRAQTWQLATGGKPWMTPEEVRDREGLPPAEIAPEPTPALPVPSTGGPTDG